MATRVPEGPATLALVVGFTPVRVAVLTRGLVVVHTRGLVVGFTPVQAAAPTLALVVGFTPVRAVAPPLVQAVAPTPVREAAPTPVQAGVAILVLAVAVLTNGTAPLHTVSDTKSPKQSRCHVGHWPRHSQDYAQAHMRSNLAASRYSPGEDRDDVAKRITPAQISEAQKLAREWRSKK